MHSLRAIETPNQSNISISTQPCIGRRGLERLDFLLLLIETIQINGVGTMLNTSRSLGIENQFNDSVQLWKTRTHNPLRKSARRGDPSIKEVKSLIELISITADRLYPLLRQLLSEKEPYHITNERWINLDTRFKDLISERMNLRRRSVQKLLQNDETHSFLRELVLLLALSSGPDGMNRLTTNINDIR